MFRQPLGLTLFPYTTLFRSPFQGEGCDEAQGHAQDDGGGRRGAAGPAVRSEEHTSELQSRVDIVCRLLLEKKNTFAPDPRKNPAAKEVVEKFRAAGFEPEAY